MREVLALDAFARCWVHERVFYEAVGKLLPATQQAGYARLFASWQAQNKARFQQAMQLLSSQLAVSAQDSEALDTASKGLLRSALQVVGIGKNEEQQRQERAMAALVARLNLHSGVTTRELLILHKLDPTDAHKINTRVRDNFAVRAPIDKAQAGLLGAMVSGAATGLSADLISGGLTLGTGALLGGVVGALTFAGAAWGFNSGTDRNHPTMQFTDAFLRTLVVAGILRYLAVAHFGRGRGNFVEGEAPAFWQDEVEHAVTRHDSALLEAWKEIRREKSPELAPAQLATIITAIAGDTLARLYPDVPRLV